MNITKKASRRFWKVFLYILLIFILFTYISHLIYLLERYFYNQFVRWIIPRYIWISLIFIITYIVFYYAFFRDYFSRNYLFLLIGLVMGHSIFLLIGAQFLGTVKTGDWFFLIQSVMLALGLLYIMKFVKE